MLVDLKCGLTSILSDSSGFLVPFCIVIGFFGYRFYTTNYGCSNGLDNSSNESSKDCLESFLVEEIKVIGDLSVDVETSVNTDNENSPTGSFQCCESIGEEKNSENSVNENSGSENEFITSNFDSQPLSNMEFNDKLVSLLINSTPENWDSLIRELLNPGMCDDDNRVMLIKCLIQCYRESDIDIFEVVENIQEAFHLCNTIIDDDSFKLEFMSTFQSILLP
jgi:hypothetical protein